MTARVTMVVGARPNFMKAAPVFDALRTTGAAAVRIVHTGQHYDREMSEVFVEQLGLPRPDEFLHVGSGTHAEQTARALVGVEADLRLWRPDVLVAPGDVNSTLAAALAAVKLGIPVCHLEAGLRSGDRSMPEEHNRVVADHLASLLLAHSSSAVANLAREGIVDGVFNIGNTMIDSVLTYVEAARTRRPWEQFGVEPGEYLLVTLHRPALVDDSSLLGRAVATLELVARELPVVFPVHPRTRRRLREGGLESTPGIIFTSPLPYLEFLGLETAARAVATDSGGVQEETSALGVPCFTLRQGTERPITVELGTNTILGLDPEALGRIPSLLSRPKHGSPIPLWDGHAGARAADAILALGA